MYPKSRPKPRLRLTAVTAIAAALALTASCSTASSTPEPSEETTAKPVASNDTETEVDGDPILIGVPVGLSGANSVIAPSVVQSSEYAIKEINEAGGVLGRPLELRVYDDQSNANGAVQAFTTAVMKDNVAAIVSMETSTARNAGLPVAQKTNTPYVYTSNYEGGACAENLFINASVPQQVADPALAYMRQEYDAKSWFLLASDYAYGRGQIEYVTSALENSGDSIVGTEYNPVDNSDWTSIIQKIKASNPDVVVTAAAGGSPNVSLVKQFREAGIDVPVLNLSIDEGSVNTIGSSAENIFYTSTYFTSIESQANDDFLAAMEEMFGEDLETPNYLSVPQYYGIHLVALAIEKAGTAESDGILETIPTVTFDGPMGPIIMDEQHHAALPIYLGQAGADGTTSIVENLGTISPGEQCPSLATQ